ncbi:hypothetical protein P168DRAFT_289789 [Aspergillus campestris IBT 28561]|uniref:Uncharacterized protein n=1 Tax=Aspergillus campestris (strain IBT 28561) TaxID=1392248 RepID=A0A2I1D501_ASPC2|nr:uncharacterized protein P168DRAFT_289789 [Aspergillus campestris IBT 28561]PKY04943.1 hypothetical protein P168DRAFT_289789 [Aspergillus campestris IBT 28561]
MGEVKDETPVISKKQFISISMRDKLRMATRNHLDLILARIKPPTAATAPRERMIKELASFVLSEKVVHVRGTPASGRTVFAKLLGDHCLREGLEVYFMRTWLILDTFDQNPLNLLDKQKAMLRDTFLV